MSFIISMQTGKLLPPFFRALIKFAILKSNLPKSIWKSMLVQYCVKNSCNILIIWGGFKKQGRNGIMYFWKGEQDCCRLFNRLKGLDGEAGQGLNRRKRDRGTIYCDNHLARDQEWLEGKVAEHGNNKRTAASVAGERVDCWDVRPEGQEEGRLLPAKAQGGGAVPGVGATLVFQDRTAQPEFKPVVWKLPMFTEVITLHYFHSY